MADPKLLRIITALYDRLITIDGTGSFYTKIGSNNCMRGQIDWDQGELPASSVYLVERAKETEEGERAKMISIATIEGHSKFGDVDPEDIAIKMLADIQRAIEVLNGSNLGGLLSGTGLSFLRDEIRYPDAGNEYVSVQVAYEIPHIRRYGDPDN